MEILVGGNQHAWIFCHHQHHPLSSQIPNGEGWVLSKWWEGASHWWSHCTFLTLRQCSKAQPKEIVHLCYILVLNNFLDVKVCIIAMHWYFLSFIGSGNVTTGMHFNSMTRHQRISNLWFQLSSAAQSLVILLL